MACKESVCAIWSRSVQKRQRRSPESIFMSQVYGYIELDFLRSTDLYAPAEADGPVNIIYVTYISDSKHIQGAVASPPSPWAAGFPDILPLHKIQWGPPPSLTKVMSEEGQNFRRGKTFAYRQLASYWLAKNCLEEESLSKSSKFFYPTGKVHTVTTRNKPISP